jgi:hypothetical protein
MRKRDINQIAAPIVSKTTVDQTKTTPRKNPAAVTLGRLGGLKGGKARAAKLTVKERKETAINAAKVRWNKPHKPGYTVGCSDSSRSGRKLKSTST